MSSNISVARTYKFFSAIDDDDNKNDNTTIIDGNCFYDCISDTNGDCTPDVTYHTTINLNLHAIYNALMALIDGGANGCIGGTKDMTILYYHLDHKRVNIGVANGHQMTNLQLAVMASYIKTISGPIIGIFNNVAADATIEQSILSCTHQRRSQEMRRFADDPNELGT